MLGGMDTTIQFKPVSGDILLMSTLKTYFPSDDIVVNMDGGVGGSWTVESPKPVLNENQQQPLEL